MPLPMNRPAPLGLEMEAPEPGEPEEAGYEIVLTLLPDGSFDVAGEPYDTLEDALKAVLQQVRSHPMGATPHDEMAAGYGAPDATR